MGSQFTNVYLRRSFLGLALLTLTLVFLSCKKRRAFKEEDAQITVEVRTLQAQVDEALKDINLVIMNRSLFRGRPAGSTPQGLTLCGFDLDTSAAYQGIMTIQYNSTECKGYKRKGYLRFTIQEYPVQKWKYQGCVIKLEFIKYSSTRLSDSRNVEINGTVFLTNSSGKTWYDLVYYYEPELIQILTGNNVTAKFNGGESFVFNFNRQMNFTFSKTDSVVTCKVSGLGSSEGESALENWGMDDEGNKFTSKVSRHLTWKTSCGPPVLFEGQEIIQVAGKPFDITCDFGMDSNGDPSTQASSCPYGWKASWSYKKKSSDRLFNYQ